MAIWCLDGLLDGGDERTVLVDSVSGLAFGPLFNDTDEAEAFLAHLRPLDARAVDPGELANMLTVWRATRREEDPYSDETDGEEANP